ncbi:TlpA family protein disulfide reductase [Halomicrococcus sp. SG-WS-1]|uniref:TlpA family protein disulfide reductase n=1 Tax=Halomicrococcus sp. SG-WS-1 TaxID=3439057 RepID=UPI003F7A970F
MGLGRRRFLALGVGSGVTALAGCFGGRSEGLSVDTLSVAGSPGEPVRVHPPGRVAVLDFFATWCAPCKPQMAHLRRVRERFDSNVFLLSITNERDRTAVRSFWRKYDGTWPVALDPELRVAERYGVHRLPTLLVVGPDGSERWRHVGLASEERIATEIERALG